jgi:sulfur carrier protein ThiS adenylyltransferase
MIFKEIKEIVSTKTVGIAGCGGLGSNCAVALARTGVGKLVVVDFDIIHKSNLNRQYYYSDQLGQQKSFTLSDNLYFVNPNVKVIAHDIKLGHKDIVRIFKDCDVIIEAFDLAEMKQLIIETVLTEMPGKPLICGMGMAGYGNNNGIRMEQYDDLYICGDFETEIANDMPPMAPRVGIVANMQANQAIELLIKMDKE